MEALYFEEKAVKHLNLTNDIELLLDIKLNKVKRLIYHNQLKEAHEITIDLISTFHDRGCKVKAIQARILLSQIYSSTSQHLKALAEIIKALNYIEDFAFLEIEVKTRLAEIYLDIAPSALTSLQILTPLYKHLDLQQFPLTCGKYFSVKAKCVFSLASSLCSNLSINLLKRGVEYCDKALTSFEDINCEYLKREIFYMQARALNQLGDVENRDKAALEFEKINQKLNWALKRTVKRENKNLEEMLCE